MTKDAYYFSHDANAQQDPKIIRLVMNMGMQGYGIFWSVVEHLRNDEDYKLNLSDCSAIAFQSHCDAKDVERVITEFDLFEVSKNNDFWSKSLLIRMQEMNIKRDKARASAFARWKPDANALQTQCDGNARKERKVKEKKDKTVYLGFDKFYSKYPKKQGKEDARKAFSKIAITDELLERIVAAVEANAKTEAWTKDDGKFVPLPATWLRGKRWEDEVNGNGKVAHEPRPFPKDV